MDREELLKLIRSGPVRVRMDSGQTHEIPSAEWAVVDDLFAHVLYRNDQGVLRTAILSLVCMESAELYEPAA